MSCWGSRSLSEELNLAHSGYEMVTETPNSFIKRLTIGEWEIILRESQMPEASGWRMTKVLRDTVLNYYSDLLTSSPTHNPDLVLNSIEPKVSSAMNQELIRGFSAEEMKTVVFQMKPSMASGPDGMTPLFFSNAFGTLWVPMSRLRSSPSSLLGNYSNKSTTHLSLSSPNRKLLRIWPNCTLSAFAMFVSKVLANRL